MKSKGKSAKVKKVTKSASSRTLRCTVCGKPTVRLMDGEPSCNEHAALVYENQLEDYTNAHLSDSVTSKV
jgi:hypothetical protein